MFTEYHINEMATERERILRNALKFGTSREVNSKEGGALAERSELAPPDCSEFRASQVNLNGAVGEVVILQPPHQCPRTKPLFDVRIDDPFLD